MNIDTTVTVFIAMLAIICAGGLWTSPRLLVGFAFVGILFTRTLSHLSGLSIVDNLDDGLVALCLLRALFHRATATHAARRYAFPGIFMFIGFLAIGLLSALIRNPDGIGTTLAGTVLAAKAVVFGWAVCQFDWKPADVRWFATRGAGVLSLVVAAAAINAVIPSAWASVFSVNGGIIARYGLPSLTGPFIHPFDLAFCASMGAVAIFAYRRYVGKTRYNFVLAFALSVVTVLTFRRKDLLGLGFASLTMLVRARSSRWLIPVALVAPIMLVLSWQEIAAQVDALQTSYFTVDSEEARTVLTLGAVTLSLQYFPLGAGFGRFGSRTAAVEYSPEYVHLGYQNVYGLGPGPTAGAFLTDTSWPAILGETGVIGTILFAVGLIAMLRRGLLIERMSTSREARWLGATTVGWFILTVFQSTGAAVFTSPPMFAFFFGITGIAVALQRHEFEPDLSDSKAFRRTLPIGDGS
jgi:hypothetical protein